MGGRMRNSYAPDHGERVERIRGAVQDSIDVIGLRPTARAIGLSPTGAKNFAVGSSMPYRPGWTRLQEWFECWSAQVPAPDSEAVEHAIYLLTRDLPDTVAAQICVELREIIAHLYPEYPGLALAA